jgi:hypothetical protein
MNIETIASDNPAARVYNALVLAQKSALAEKAKIPHYVQRSKVWGRVFVCSHDDLLTIYRNLAAVREQLNEAERLINIYAPDVAELHLAHYQLVRQILGPSNLTEQWSQDLLSDPIMVNLRLGAKVLHRHCAEQVLDDDWRGKFEREISAVAEILDGADANDDLSSILRDLLEIARNAARDYHITGIQGVRDAIFIFLGRYSNNEILQKNKDDPRCAQIRNLFSKMAQGLFVKGVSDMVVAVIKHGYHSMVELLAQN